MTSHNGRDTGHILNPQAQEFKIQSSPRDLGAEPSPRRPLLSVGQSTTGQRDVDHSRVIGIGNTGRENTCIMECRETFPVGYAQSRGPFWTRPELNELHWKDEDTGSAHNLVSYQSPLSRSNTESLLTPAVPRFTLPIRALGHEVSLRSELPPSISVKKSYETLEPIPSRKDIMMAHDRGLFTPSAKHQSRQPGRTVDWNCLSCGISYTDDVQHCIVCIRFDMSAPVSLQHQAQFAASVGSHTPRAQDPGTSTSNTLESPFRSNTATNTSSFGKVFESYPSPTVTLDRLLKHVEALLRLGHSGVDLKDVLVEGDISLCMDLGMKGLFGKEALNPWKTLSINIPDQPFLKQMPKPPLGSVAGDWTCSCGRENWAKRSVCSRCFPGIEPEYKAIVYNRVKPVFDLVTTQLRETHLRLDAEKLSSEERRLRRRDMKP